MKKIIPIGIASLLIITVIFGIKNTKAESMVARVSGKILLQVEEKGEAWYVNPSDSQRYYMGRPEDAFSLMRRLGVGISNLDIKKIPIGDKNLAGDDYDGDGLSDDFEKSIGTIITSADTDGDGYNDKEEIIGGYNPNGPGKMAIDSFFANNQKGKILLQVEKNGEAWYVDPNSVKRFYLGRPKDAFNIMRELGLGIRNSDLAEIRANDKFLTLTSKNEETSSKSVEPQSLPENDNGENPENTVANDNSKNKDVLYDYDFVLDESGFSVSSVEAELLEDNIALEIESSIPFKIKRNANDPSINYGVSFENFCVTEDEIELWRLVNEYRASKGLNEVKLSKSLSFIEKVHAFDAISFPYDNSSCNLHSWSSQNAWSGCCAVTGKRDTYHCLDDKLSEFVGDTDLGITAENAAGFSSTELKLKGHISPEAALNGWKKSHGHNIMMINKEGWSGVKWQSMGVTIYNGIAFIMMSEKEDPNGEPTACSDNNYSACEKQANEYLKAQCIYEQVANKLELAKCEYITCGQYKRCLDEKKYNKTVCQMLEYDAEVRDDCYYNMSIIRKDAESCAVIKDDNTKSDCYSITSMMNRESQNCALVKEKNRDWCYRYSFDASKGFSECQPIVDRVTRNICYAYLAQEAKDFSVCEYIENIATCEQYDASVCEYHKNGGGRTDCINSICRNLLPSERAGQPLCQDNTAFEEGVAYCNKMQVGDTKDYCFLGKADKTDVFKYCEYIEKIDTKDRCYDDAADSSRDIALCEYITDEAKKNICKSNRQYD